MKSLRLLGRLVWILVLPALTLTIEAGDTLPEKKRTEAIENFVVSNRKSDGNFSTISLKNWQNELGIPFFSTEDLIRGVLNTFEEHYKNLKIVYYLIIYANKPGPTGGIVCDFLVIHHETLPEKTYRFAARQIVD